MSTNFEQPNLTDPQSVREDTERKAHPGSATARDREMGRDSEPLGDHGQSDKSWTPPAGEQGISNRPDDAGGAAKRNGEGSASGACAAEDAEEEGTERATPGTTTGDAGGTS